MRGGNPRLGRVSAVPTYPETPLGAARKGISRGSKQRWQADAKEEDESYTSKSLTTGVEITALCRYTRVDMP
jgi:hypothetical protein